MRRNYERINVYQLGASGLAAGSQSVTNAYTANKPVTLVNMSITITDNQPSNNWWIAVVYTPNGYTTNSLSVSAGTNVYEPSQHLMLISTQDSGADTREIKIPTSRKLKADDAIEVII